MTDDLSESRCCVCDGELSHGEYCATCAKLPDFSVTDHGTVWTFEAISHAGHSFVAELDLEPWQLLEKPGSFAVDHRPARALREAIASAGLIIED